MFHKKQISPRFLRRMINLWPPFIGAGIKVVEISKDWRFARVKLRKGLLNRNYFGVHFGGSLFAMSDAIYVLLIANILGDRYIVWDKGASIEYLKPGKTHVFADFHVTDEHLEQIKHHTRLGEKYEPEYIVDIVDQNGEVIAKVHKKLYIKLKKRYRDQNGPD